MVVKADNGTYGMGIMTVRDAKDMEVSCKSASRP